MVHNIAIKDAIYEKLSEMKGKGSFSNAIESLMEKSSIVMPDSRPKQPDTTATPNA